MTAENKITERREGAWNIYYHHPNGLDTAKEANTRSIDLMKSIERYDSRIAL